jgi:hypothetical protein
MPVPDDGGKPKGIQFHPENPNVLFATTDRGVHRSLDFGEKFLGESWETVTAGLPPVERCRFVVALAPGLPGRIYAILDRDLFTRRLDESEWRPGGPLGFGRYAEQYPWIVPDPSNPERAFSGIKSQYSGMGVGSLLQETRDGGMTWSNGLKTVYERYAKGRMKAVFDAMIPGEITAPAIDPRNPMVVYIGSSRGILKSEDGGETWQEKKAGLDIRHSRRPSRLIPPRNRLGICRHSGGPVRVPGQGRDLARRATLPHVREEYPPRDRRRGLYRRLLARPVLRLHRRCHGKCADHGTGEPVGPE